MRLILQKLNLTVDVLRKTVFIAIFAAVLLYCMHFLTDAMIAVPSLIDLWLLSALILAGLSAAIIHRYFNKFSRRLRTLSKRELEVYKLLVLGKSNKEICTELFIANSTLKSHIHQIYKKLKISGRKEIQQDLHKE